MKKLQFWAVILPLMIIFFSSCDYNIPPPRDIGGAGFHQFVEKICPYQTPVLAKRFDCKGNVLRNPKVIGWSNDTCRRAEFVFLSDSTLNFHGYYYDPQKRFGNIAPDPTGSNKNFGKEDWVNFPWEWLFGLLLLAVFLFALISIFNQLKEKNTNTTQNGAPVVTTPASHKVSESRMSSTTYNYTEEGNFMDRMMKSMKDNGVDNVAVEFPDGPRVKMSSDGNKKKGVINLKKEEKPADQKSDQK